jgi:hypothetical protein
MKPVRIRTLRLSLLILLWLARPAPSAAPPPSTEDAAKEERRLLLQAVGLLASAQVYQAYLNIGFVADARASGTHAEKDLAQIMDSVVQLLNATDAQLEKIAQLDLTKADRDAIDRIRKLSQLVRRQADELRAFWKTGDKDRAANYEKLRQEAWEGIRALLNLK